jgi:hypothetical protein
LDSTQKVPQQPAHAIRVMLQGGFMSSLNHFKIDMAFKITIRSKFNGDVDFKIITGLKFNSDFKRHVNFERNQRGHETSF